MSCGGCKSLIGWYKINQPTDDKERKCDNVVGHYYSSQKSLCGESNLLEAPHDATFVAPRKKCKACRKILDRKMRRRILKREAEHSKACDEFLKSNKIAVEKIIVNYAMYPMEMGRNTQKTHKLGNLVRMFASQDWNGCQTLDWITCILRCIVSGVVSSGIVKDDDSDEADSDV